MAIVWTKRPNNLAVSSNNGRNPIAEWFYVDDAVLSKTSNLNSAKKNDDLLGIIS